MSLPRPAALTVDNYHAQQAVSREVVRAVLRLWAGVDPVAVDRSWAVISTAITQAIEAGHAKSAASALAYVHDHAAWYGVLIDPAAAPVLDAARIETAIRVTGPVAVKVAARGGMTPSNAARSAAVQLSGAAQRLARAGGRDALMSAIDKSPHVDAYRRVGVGASCDFCSTLISRGAVYLNAGTAGAGGFHDHDDCDVEPIYHGQAEPPEVAEHLARYAARA